MANDRAAPPSPAGSILPGEIPPELDRWNWGAFLLNWIWGLGNRTPIALLMFVPLVNLAMPFVLGAKGSAWAWRNNRWDSAAHFRKVQRMWAVGGVAVLVGAAALFAGIVVLVLVLLKGSEPYRLGVERLKNAAQAVDLLGEPVAAGRPMGSINTAGAHGEAELDFAASGSKGKGSVHLRAVKEFGQWRVTSERLKMDGQDEPVDIPPPAR